MQKRKRMTVREKALRAEAKKQLQEEGIIPPDKPKLNRKKFAKDVLDEYEKSMSEYEDYPYLSTAIHFMVNAERRKITAEEVGILKLIKIAVEHKKFNQANKAKGISSYKIGDFYEQVIKPVRDL